MGARQFDYYIFIDYSEDILGYLAIEKKNIAPLLPKITKFAHYNTLKYKPSYLRAIRKIIKKHKVFDYFCKLKIRQLRDTPEIYADLAEFLKSTRNCCIFISIDDKQYSNFERFIQVVDGDDNMVVKESALKKGSIEYRLSLILDTLLNIERVRREHA